MLKFKKSLEIPLVVIMLIFTIFLTACADTNSKSNPATYKNSFAVRDENGPSAASGDFSEIESKTSEPYEGDLELPVVGATGYTSVALDLKTSADSDSETIEILEAGTAFEIVKEEGDWWLIQKGTSSGWLQHKYSLINLPDVIPSIIYDNTNTYSSKFVSSGKAIPNITGNSLYSGKTYNERLGKEEYIMPVLYSMSQKIYLAQQYALSEGNSLKIYEAYRPYAVQKTIVNALTALANNDSEVMTGINTSPWSISWFIATSLSNHQRGGAIDVSLVKINSQEDISIGGYTSLEITNYTEYTMPTQIHELSMASAAFTTPVTSKSATAWMDATLAKSMNEAARNLQTYSTNAGLTPLASEWWHFNDLDAMNETAENTSDGSYILTECYSVSPPKQVD